MGLLPPLFGDIDNEFPPGNLLRRPDKETCVVPLSPAMRDMERCLERALIVCVRGTRPEVTALEVAPIHVERDLSRDSFSVHPYFPENFLVVFNNRSIKDRFLHEGSIRTHHFLLIVRPWSRLALAVSHPLRFRVKLSLEGLPLHAWSLMSVSAILSPSCWVEAFDELSASCADLSAFRLVAWSLNPNMIPKEKSVVIVEPDLLPDGIVLDHRKQVFTTPFGARECQEALRYNVIIHVHDVKDFSSSAERHIPFAPSSDDSGFDGLPDNDYEESKPRQHTFHTSPGVVDGCVRPAEGREEGSFGRRTRSSTFTHSWRLPHFVT